VWVAITRKNVAFIEAKQFSPCGGPARQKNVNRTAFCVGVGKHNDSYEGKKACYSSSFELDVVPYSVSSGWATSTGRLLGPKGGKQH